MVGQHLAGGAGISLQGKRQLFHIRQGGHQPAQLVRDALQLRRVLPTLRQDSTHQIARSLQDACPRAVLFTPPLCSQVSRRAAYDKKAYVYSLPFQECFASKPHMPRANRSAQQGAIEAAKVGTFATWRPFLLQASVRAEAGRADAGEPWRLARGGLRGHAWRLPQDAPGCVEGAMKRLVRVGLLRALPPGGQVSSQRAPAHWCVGFLCGFAR